MLNWQTITSKNIFTMPELPEVETVVCALRGNILQRTIVDVKTSNYKLRYLYPENFAANLIGQQIMDIRRRSKYILIELSSGRLLVAHLGMSGALLHNKHPWEAKHSHVFFHLDDGHCVTYHDPRRFGFITIIDKDEFAQHPLFARLGMEPLTAQFTPSYLQRVLLNKKQPIKTAIMDASLVVGVGNIYACESLFMAGILPTKSACLLSVSECERLVIAIKKVLKEAILSGGSTLKDYTLPDGKSGYFQHKFMVYGRYGKPCYKCKNVLEKIVLAGRSTFYCTNCQHS